MKKFIVSFLIVGFVSTMALADDAGSWSWGGYVRTKGKVNWAKSDGILTDPADENSHDLAKTTLDFEKGEVDWDNDNDQNRAGITTKYQNGPLYTEFETTYYNSDKKMSLLGLFEYGEVTPDNGFTFKFRAQAKIIDTGDNVFFFSPSGSSTSDTFMFDKVLQKAAGYIKSPDGQFRIDAALKGGYDNSLGEPNGDVTGGTGYDNNLDGQTGLRLYFAPSVVKGLEAAVTWRDLTESGKLKTGLWKTLAQTRFGIKYAFSPITAHLALRLNENKDKGDDGDKDAAVLSNLSATVYYEQAPLKAGITVQLDRTTEDVLQADGTTFKEEEVKDNLGLEKVQAGVEYQVIPDKLWVRFRVIAENLNNREGKNGKLKPLIQGEFNADPLWIGLDESGVDAIYFDSDKAKLEPQWLKIKPYVKYAIVAKTLLTRVNLGLEAPLNSDAKRGTIVSCEPGLFWSFKGDGPTDATDAGNEVFIKYKLAYELGREYDKKYDINTDNLLTLGFRWSW